MDKELKEKWVKALRSGAWKQARGRLRDGDAYCCLGVLCKVAGIPISDSGFFDGVASAEEYGGVFDGAESAEDDDSVLYGYEPIWKIIGNADAARDFSEANDKGVSFDQLADMIEERL